MTRYSKRIYFDTDYSPAARILSTLVTLVHRGDNSKTLGLRPSARVLLLACGGFEAFRSRRITTNSRHRLVGNMCWQNSAACATRKGVSRCSSSCEDCMLQGSALALCSSRRHSAASHTEKLEPNLILTRSSDINDAVQDIAPVDSAVQLLRRRKS